MAKAKKRTKTAIAARKYGRKLKNRVKAGEPEAIALVQRRWQYHQRYNAKKRQQREDERMVVLRKVEGPEIRAARSAGEDEQTGKADATAPQSEADNLPQEETSRESSTLFCTPAPPTFSPPPDRNDRETGRCQC